MKSPRIMKVFRSLFVACSLVAVIAPPLPARSEAGSFVIPIDTTLSNDGSIVLAASVNGSEPRHFLFDTGAPDVVTPDVAAQIDLSITGPALRAEGAGQQGVSVRMGSARTLTIGDVSLSSVPFIVAPLPASIVNVTRSRYRIAGIVGRALLQHYVVLID